MRTLLTASFLLLGAGQLFAQAAAAGTGPGDCQAIHLNVAATASSNPAGAGYAATTVPLLQSMWGRPVDCPLTPKLHFERYLHSQFGPTAPLQPLLSVSFDQWFTTHGGYHSDLDGYADHYRVEFEEEATSKLMRHLIFPTIFAQDENYQPMGSGPVTARLGSAATHMLFTESADHSHMEFNMEGIPASFASAWVGNYFEPGSERGWNSVRGNFLWSITWRVVGDILTEFGPDIRGAIEP